MTSTYLLTLLTASLGAVLDSSMPVILSKQSQETDLPLNAALSLLVSSSNTRVTEKLVHLLKSAMSRHFEQKGRAFDVNTRF